MPPGAFSQQFPVVGVKGVDHIDGQYSTLLFVQILADSNPI